LQPFCRGPVDKLHGAKDWALAGGIPRMSDQRGCFVLAGLHRRTIQQARASWRFSSARASVRISQQGSGPDAQAGIGAYQQRRWAERSSPGLFCRPSGVGGGGGPGSAHWLREHCRAARGPGRARSRELAGARGVGAGRRRLAAQLLTESLVLAALGGDLRAAWPGRPPPAGHMDQIGRVDDARGPGCAAHLARRWASLWPQRVCGSLVRLAPGLIGTA